MKIHAHVVLLSLVSLVQLTAEAQQTPPDIAATARTNAEQQQQVQQQRDAQQRAATVAAPVVRSAAPLAGAWPVLPVETPCFRIDSFSVEVPDALPEVARVKGASALPMDRFAFLHDWLRHYEGQCVGKQGLDMLTKGLQGVVLSHGCMRLQRPAMRRLL
jgi:hemolysin activation/secretion protein